LIVTVHDLIFMRYPQDYHAGWLAITNALLPRVLRRAAAIIADSHATKADVTRFFDVREGKVVVIYPGIDAATPSELHQRDTSIQKLSGEAPYILCLGPWVRRKNLPVVVEAFSLLAPRIPELGLVITGERPRGMQGDTEEELLSHLSSEYRNRVHLVGYVSQADKEALVSHAGVLGYPSCFEGFGLPPLEAMSLGTPVVAAATPAVMEVAGGAALMVDPDDPAQWAAAIEQVLRSSGVADRLRAAGMRRSALFTWERCARQTAQLYKLVAFGRARGSAGLRHAQGL